MHMFNEQITIQDTVMVMNKRYKGHKFVQESRPFDTLVYVYKGMLDISVDDQTFRVPSKNLIFIPQNSYTVTDYLYKENAALCIGLKLCGGQRAAVQNPMVFELSTAAHAQALLLELIHSNLCSDRFFRIAKTYELLMAINKSSLHMDHQFARILPAYEEINLHYNKNVKISEYAKMSAMCETLFRKLFYAYTGKTPIAYRNFLRLTHADELIKYGDYTAAEAAEIVGFNNFSFFCREYKKLFGTCSSYRVRKT